MDHELGLELEWGVFAKRRIRWKGKDLECGETRVRGYTDGEREVLVERQVALAFSDGAQ